MKKIVDKVKAQPNLWSDTAIIITFDEGGGYYDSGYVQALDLFWRRHPHPNDRRVPVHKTGAYLA